MSLRHPVACYNTSTHVSHDVTRFIRMCDIVWHESYGFSVCDMTQRCDTIHSYVWHCVTWIIWHFSVCDMTHKGKILYIVLCQSLVAVHLGCWNNMNHMTLLCVCDMTHNYRIQYIVYHNIMSKSAYSTVHLGCWNNRDWRLLLLLLMKKLCNSFVWNSQGTVSWLCESCHTH